MALSFSSMLSMSTSTSTWSREAPRAPWRASITAFMECSCRMQVRRTSTSSCEPHRPSRTFCPTSSFVHSWTTKYVVHFQEHGYNYHISYLQSDNTALCKVLAVHIHLDVQPAKRTDYLLYARGSTYLSESSCLETTDVTNPILLTEAALELLQESIKRVQDGPPSLTTICFYAFYNTQQLLNTSEISSDSKLLAAGFDNSCIKHRSMRLKKLKSEPHHVDTSIIPLACHTLEEEENEEGNIGTEMKILRGHCGLLYSTRFITDSSGLLSCSEDMSIRYWDLKSFTNTVLYQGHAYPVYGIDISPYSLNFASGSHDHTARLWSLD